ncbi:MAG: cytochrome c3 family protein [Proteobacteria bacterium]|nr:cytochrome c3 family protein [Pseudomonadota bacterium]MBU4383598.1 cytochrome c3 family protein [Pseudomonadota bacterium]MBU4604145.1 cytochrome c3 family protein [Pseudomonadota bacterium]MCG2763824.1 cytochrome c3 family protein [Desulfarculaceae bacterium]
MNLHPRKSRVGAAYREANPLLWLGTVLFLGALLWLWGGVSWASESAGATDNQTCLICHQKEGLDDGAGKDLGPHQGLSCLDCHQGAQRYPHEEIKLASCLNCHTPHTEATTGDLHAGFSCEACHWAGSGQKPHLLASTQRPQSCRRCHFAGNAAGAPATVLPAKGALCLVCHTATLSLPDWPSRLALAGFLLGLLASLGFWFSGGGQGPASKALHKDHQGGGFGHGAAALLLDGLLQRRLWRLSPGRWLVHALMVLPFVARMLWALLALVLSYAQPGADLTQAMLGKNYPATALFFDLTGLLVLAGAALAIMRRALRGGAKLPGLPGPDWTGMGLLAAVVISGFITEAARLALTGVPEGSWAFLGWALSGLFSAGPGLQTAYGYLWYAHAILFAAFVVYLPFSRMKHILLAPLNLAIKAARGEGQKAADK